MLGGGGERQSSTVKHLKIQVSYIVSVYPRNRLCRHVMMQQTVNVGHSTIAV